MEPKVSVIIPCYNHGLFVREAIRSVEECSDKYLYEIIILNDGSTDIYTIEVLQQLAAEGYHVISQCNQGLGAARNNAIKEARGEYILPLDSDNKICSDYIYESIRILDEQPGIAMVYGDVEYFGKKSGRHIVGEFNLQKIMIGNIIDACAVYRKSVWEALGGYDEKMPVMGFEDWDLWLNMALHRYEFYYIPKVLFHYRVLDSSMLNSIKQNDTVVLGKYMQSKYKKYLSQDHINNTLLNLGRNNKMLALKLFLASAFPGALEFLVKNRIIKSRNII
ncbi:MAG: glycosyltransferase [Bacteroidota bacterium]|nr:glycosyltransferase [Bacteroidota bacterium]